MPEWGLITGYDDETQEFATLAINEKDADPTGGLTDDLHKPDLHMPYDKLGKREIPILSVLTFTGKSDKPQDAILYETTKLAGFHLEGGEYCENASGLEAYPALIRHLQNDFHMALSWNMEYFLGTFEALKYHAWKYFERTRQLKLSELYRAVYDEWQESFRIKTTKDISRLEVRERIALLLKSAQEDEMTAVQLMSEDL